MIGSVEDVRFDLTGYDDAVESWEEEVARLAAEDGVPGWCQVLCDSDGTD